MKLVEKIKESFLSHIAESILLLVIGIFIWVENKITKLILPAIGTIIPIKLLISLFMYSFFINLIFLLYIWILVKKGKNKLKLKYNILWDKEKNPYCPSCQKPGIAYDQWTGVDYSYYCSSCNKYFYLKDPSGINIKPAKAISELK